MSIKRGPQSLPHGEGSGGLLPRPLGVMPESASTHKVRVRDGARLATDVYLPPNLTKPVPAVVCRLPYGKNDPENTLEQIAKVFTSRGYAFVAQDTRGKGGSEGEAWPFTSEVVDSYDTFEWVVGQSWSDGRIATWGASYYGFTQWAGIASQHPALVAALPTVTTSRAQEWLWRQGVFELGFAAAWSGITWMDKFVYPFGLQFDWSVDLPEVLPAAFGGRDSAAYRFMRAARPESNFWRTSIFPNGTPANAPKVAMLHSGGWWDLFNRGQVRDWSLSSATSPAAQILVMDSIDHAFGEWTQYPAGIPVVESMAPQDVAAFCESLLDRPLRLLDQEFFGQPSGLGQVEWRLTHGDWHTSSTWPPPEARPFILHLSDVRGDLQLTRRPQQAGSWRNWKHDPSTPVPTQGEPSTMYDLCLPPDDTAVEGRDDVLVLSSEPFETRSQLVGPVVANLYVESSAPEMDVVVRLLDVFPDGRTRRIRDGAAHVHAARGGAHIRVDLGHTAYALEAGHRLRLHLASSDFPRFLPYLGPGRDPWTDQPGPGSNQRVRVGGRLGSSITLSVLS